MKKIYALPSVKTNNFIDLGEKIIKQWNEFLSLNLSSGTKYAIYSNYDSDYKGDYEFSVGVENYFTDSKEVIIPSLNYMIFSCHQSEIVSKWKEIWDLEEKQKLNRDYKFDFEKHYPNGNLDIYIGVK